MGGNGVTSSVEAEYRHSLAQFVRDHEREILATWVDSVRQINAEERRPTSALIARVSPVLRWLVDKNGAPGGPASLDRLAGELAAARMAEGTDETEIVAEWSLLRDCLLSAWAATLGSDDWATAMAVVHGVVDTCVMAAVERFARAHARTLAAVENVSKATFESTTVDELLQRLLQTFKDAAPTVDAAVIALCEGENLRLHAVVGMDVTGHTTVRKGDGFIGRIAIEKRPLESRHAAVDRLFIHPEIPTSGMRAAYGLPLVEDGSVVGVAAIGSRTAWEFTQADRAIFDVIARRAASSISYWQVREVFDREKAQLGVLLAQLPAGIVVAEAPSGKLTQHNVQIELIWRRPFAACESVEQYGAWPGYRADGQRIAPDEWPLARAVRNGETTLNEEIEILRGDGSRGAILVSAAPIRGPDGRIVSGVCALTDVTHRREIEEQLKLSVDQAHRAATFQKILSEASERLAEAVEMEATAMSIAQLGLPEIADTCGVYELEDDGGLRLVGFADVDEAKTGLFLQRVAGLPSLVPAAGLKEVLDERKPRIVPDLNQERLRDAGIDPIYVELIRELGIESLMLLPLVARGRTLGVLTYASGESGRSFSPDALELAQGLAQRASLALDNAHMYDAARRAAAELSGLISIAPDAIITIDGDQRIVMYNEGAERIFGWKRADAIGKPVEVLMPERARATYRRHVHDLVAGPVAARSIGYRAISWGLRNDGTEFPVEAAISKLEIGEKRLFTVVLRDITERLRLEREREAAIAMRDDVMGIVAHDLRNPLATIATAVSVLKECSGDETLLKSGFVIERATRRMNRLIQDLLDVTRIEAGHLFIEPKQVSTQQAVLDCVDAQAQQITAASLVLDVQLSPDVVDVRADPDRLQQVLENLIGNAVKFSKAGGRVTVGARTSNQDVLFWVKDAGIGIAAEDVPHIFERFWQCGSQRRRGAGLGLTIVKGIVDAHGGRVWAESALGRGTTFFFTIPAEPTGEVGPGAPPRRR